MDPHLYSRAGTGDAIILSSLPIFSLGVLLEVRWVSVKGKRVEFWLRHGPLAHPRNPAEWCVTDDLQLQIPSVCRYRARGFGILGFVD